MRYAVLSRFEKLDYACNEAMNTLCTNLEFSGRNVKKIMFTSCRPQEGKSFLTLNMMRTLAGLGKRVVLVDCDLRRSMLESRYVSMIEGEKLGMTHYLAGQCQAEDIVYQTNIQNAYLVMVGRDVANSLQLLSTPLLRQLLDQLAESFDYVLVDAPPVGTIIDAALIAKDCDGIVFVVSSSLISRRELIDSVNQLRKTETPILGTVLNKVEFDSSTAKKYYYKSYYTYYYKKGYDTKNGKPEKARVKTTKKKPVHDDRP
ncbi:MAG: CpsD/CapB family tyrosine-protein kinase [Eubacteriales bacterium]|nr:CpsD/CapB family tyrosine-protein kinase [Eubacteriales bacterium]MDD3880630.1 CpsD/CapB family tyrosine-protein kinase [Eubacteriales bacterium]MDD4513536.1 CpsD/CapB family tyrosine-protein kinase [Eubacteriales bacterium]